MTNSIPYPEALLDRSAAYTTPRQDIFDLVPPDAQRILDVGCSNGALGRSLISARFGRSVSGIEFDAAFAKEAEQYLSYVVNADLNTFNWYQEFQEKKFDCIIFADVLEHLIDPQRCLSEALQHLQPGGSVIISLPNIRHLSALKSIFISGYFPRRDRGIFDRTHLRWFTHADANAMISECGLRITTNSQSLRWGDIGGGLSNRLLNRLPSFIRRMTLVREFLTYQMCFRAER